MKTNSHRLGFVQIPILVSLAASILVLGGGTIVWKHWDISKNIEASENLSASGRHTEAISNLEEINKSWLARTLSIKSEAISEKLSEFRQREEHKTIFNDALLEVEQEQFEAAVEELESIPESSFYWREGQLKIIELQKAILEGQLAIERVARSTAERRVVLEQSAKEVAQQEAVTQTERADDEERAKYIELSRTNPLVKALTSGELTFYIEPLPHYAADGVDVIIEGLADVFDEWDIFGAPVRRVYSPDSADLTISWVRDYGDEVIGQAIFRAHLKVGLGSTNCFGEWKPFDGNTVGKIFWHELGHSMGYGHTSDSGNIMYHETQTRFVVEREIEDVIAAGWTLTIPLCNPGEYLYSFDTESSYTGFNLYVLPPGTSGSDIQAGTGKYYPDCSATNMSRYSDTCSVASGSKIYLENTSLTNTIRISGKTVSLYEPPVPDLGWPADVFQYDDAELQKIQSLF
ncbi:MAG: hypothetical protein WD883_00420 [Candidatus Colwellbacteria bacterium]